MIYKHHLEAALKEEGYNPKAIFNHWRDEEWIVTSREGGFDYRVREEGRTISGIAIRVNALEAVCGTQTE